MSEGTPKFIVFLDVKAGDYRWRLRSASGETLAASQAGYADKATCEHEVRRLKSNSYPDAQVRDLTVGRAKN